MVSLDFPDLFIHLTNSSLQIELMDDEMAWFVMDINLRATK